MISFLIKAFSSLQGLKLSNNLKSSLTCLKVWDNREWTFLFLPLLKLVLWVFSYDEDAMVLYLVQI